MSDLPAQIAEALAFLENRREDVEAICQFPGVEAAEIDFSTVIHDPYWATRRFPPELLSLVGALGITLALSTYPSGEASPGPI